MAKKQKIQTAEEFTNSIRNGLIKKYVENSYPAYTRDAKTDLIDQYMQLREVQQMAIAEDKKKTMEICHVNNQMMKILNVLKTMDKDWTD